MRLLSLSLLSSFDPEVRSEVKDLSLSLLPFSSSAVLEKKDEKMR